MGQPVVPGIVSLRTRRPRLRAVASTVALASFMLLAGCGGGDDQPSVPAGTTAASTPPPVSWTLVLDYEPNAVHAGILRAKQAGYFADEGIDLKIVAPSSTADALTQVTRGKAQVGLGDLIDVARRNERAIDAARAKGEGTDEDPAAAVTIAAGVVQRPLSGLIVRADSGITNPAQLAGKRIAVSGVPSDEAVVAAMVRKDGRPLATEQITLGFNGLKALDAKRVDATTAYWPADEVSLEQLGTKGRVFPLYKYGGQIYPGLVAFTERETAVSDPVHTRGFGDALVKGTKDVIADSSLGLAAVQDAYPELDEATTKAQLANYVPLFGTQDEVGQFSDLAPFTLFAERAALTQRRLSVREVTGVPTGEPAP